MCVCAHASLFLNVPVRMHISAHCGSSYSTGVCGKCIPDILTAGKSIEIRLRLSLPCQCAVHLPVFDRSQVAERIVCASDLLGVRRVHRSQGGFVSISGLARVFSPLNEVAVRCIVPAARPAMEYGRSAFFPPQVCLFLQFVCVEKRVVFPQSGNILS